MADPNQQAPLNVDDFAAKIKAKYPEYANIDNALLAQRIVAKYPEYATQVNLSQRAQAPAATQPQQPDSAVGGIINRIMDTGKSLAQTLDPRQTLSAIAHGDVAGAIANTPVYRMAHGLVQAEQTAGPQAVQQLKDASAIPSGNAGIKALKYGQAGVTALSMLDPFATGSVSNINNLSAQGRVSDATGQGVTDAAVLGATAAVPSVARALPSVERAGAALQDIRSTAGGVPIDMTRPGNTALEIYTQSQRGATLPSTIRKFINRAVDPNQPPMTYAEAKDFQSNVSSLSADELGKLNPNMKRLVGQLNSDLKGSLQEAAETQGKGQQFADAMSEYRNALRMKGLSEKAINLAVKAAITGGAGALGYKAFSAATEK